MRVKRCDLEIMQIQAFLKRRQVLGTFLSLSFFHSDLFHSLLESLGVNWSEAEKIRL